MRPFMTARRVFPIVALSVVVAAAAACSSAPAPLAGAGQPAAQTSGNPAAATYSCYYADDSRADRVVGGRTLHWCGPVPRAVQ